MNDEFVDVVENVELLLFEIKALRAGHAGFRITHRFHNPGSDCAPGEEAAAVHFMYRGREFYVRLTGILLLLFEYLARHSHLPQTAPQIVAGMRADPFFQRHGANVTSRVPQARKISRSCIKVYVERLRIALGQTFRDAHVTLDP